jgi:uncharacterized membrane protein YkvA (DUF1232 family)
MLYKLLERVTAGIDALETETEAPRFALQLRKFRPDLFELLDEPEAERSSLAVAIHMLGIVKEIPVIVDSIRSAVELRSTHPSVRCAMVGSLTYLVQPHDLLPDDLPGGYGFIDDSLILRATVSEYFETLPPGFTSSEKEREVLRLLALCAPAEDLPRFQAAVDGVWHLFQRLMLLPPSQIGDTIQTLIDEPLETPLPQLGGQVSAYSPGPDLVSMYAGCTIKVMEKVLKVVCNDGTVEVG